MKRRTFDTLLSITGFVLAAILLAAGGLLAWGGNFAKGTVHDQLVVQKISFGAADSFADDCLKPLAGWAEKPVDSAEAANAYAALIHCHLESAYVGMGLASDETYASLGRVRGLDQATDEAKTLNAARDLAFKGETLRSILLTAYAFGTLGAVASVASIVAYAVGALMLLLAILGLMHARRTSTEATL